MPNGTLLPPPPAGEHYAVPPMQHQADYQGEQSITILKTREKEDVSWKIGPTCTRQRREGKNQHEDINKRSGGIKLENMKPAAAKNITAWAGEQSNFITVEENVERKKKSEDTTSHDSIAQTEKRTGATREKRQMKNGAN